MVEDGEIGAWLSGEFRDAFITTNGLSMNLIILGAGHIGCSLTGLALQDGHNVTLIDADDKRAQEASQKFDATVLHCDISEDDVLAEAGADHADALVATTRDDSANLMAMFLGLERGIKTLLSIVNHAHHRKLFERLGVHVLQDPEIILAQHLYGVLRQPKLEDVITLPGGAEMFEVTVAKSSPLLGKSLSEASREGLLADGLLIVLIRRENKTLVPSVHTTLSRGDQVTVFSQTTVSDEQLKAFTGQ